MGQLRNVYRVLVGYLGDKEPLEGVAVCGRMIFINLDVKVIVWEGVEWIRWLCSGVI